MVEWFFDLFVRERSQIQTSLRRSSNLCVFSLFHIMLPLLISCTNCKDASLEIRVLKSNMNVVELKRVPNGDLSTHFLSITFKILLKLRTISSFYAFALVCAIFYNISKDLRDKF